MRLELSPFDCMKVNLSPYTIHIFEFEFQRKNDFGNGNQYLADESKIEGKIDWIKIIFMKTSEKQKLVKKFSVIKF